MITRLGAQRMRPRSTETRDGSGAADPPPRSGHPTIRFAAGAVAAATLFVVVYLVFVTTAVGQWLENLALDGVTFREESEIKGSLSTLSTISVVSFGLAIVVTASIALLRRRFRLAVAAAVVMGISVVLAEVLKEVLPRPALVDAPPWLRPNSFPSGHAAIAASIGIGVLLVVPGRLRWLALPLSAGYASVIAQAVQVAGWHRLSGTVGSALLVFAVAGILLAVLSTSGFVRRSTDGTVDRRIRRVLVVTALAAIVAGCLIGLLPFVFPLLVAPTGAAGVFAHTALDLVGIGLTAGIVIAFEVLIEPYSLGRPPEAPAPPEAPTTATA